MGSGPVCHGVTLQPGPFSTGRGAAQQALLLLRGDPNTIAQPGRRRTFLVGDSPLSPCFWGAALVHVAPALSLFCPCSGQWEEGRELRGRANPGPGSTWHTPCFLLARTWSGYNTWLQGGLGCDFSSRGCVPKELPRVLRGARELGRLVKVRFLVCTSG